MKDLYTIPEFTFDFFTLWSIYFPDWRFSQLCCNFFEWIENNKGIDSFYVEEEQLLELFDDYCKEFGKKILN